MTLSSLLDRDHIVLQMESVSHWAAIEELVDELVKTKSLPGEEAREAVLESMRRREDQISTGIGSGVAIPHAFSEDLEEIAMVFGRSSKGIDFEAIDNAPVHIVLLFVVPKKAYHQHLQTLATIGRLLTNCEVRRRLMAAETRREVLDILDSRPSRMC